LENKKEIRKKKVLKRQVRISKKKGKHLVLLPGNPICRVTSISPTSMRNSRALVAATPQILPANNALSIFLLSCQCEDANIEFHTI
jgi:hypothetical protein